YTAGEDEFSPRFRVGDDLGQVVFGEHIRLGDGRKRHDTSALVTVIQRNGIRRISLQIFKGRLTGSLLIVGNRTLQVTGVDKKVCYVTSCLPGNSGVSIFYVLARQRKKDADDIGNHRDGRPLRIIE